MIAKREEEYDDHDDGDDVGNLNEIFRCMIQFNYPVCPACSSMEPEN